MTVTIHTRALLLVALISILGLSCSKTDNRPVTEEGFWPVATPEEKNIDGVRLQEAGRRLAEMNNGHALLVIREGALVYEQYLRGHNRNSLLHLRSITKSVVGLLAGIAIEEGLMNREDLVISYFSDLDTADLHPSWKSVTVHHLLNMLSGMRWDETSETIPWLSNEYEPLSNLFARDFTQTPGDHFNYSTAAVDLLGYLIEAAAGMPLDAFAITRLAEPLGVETFEWERDINDKVHAGTGMQLRPRDLAKLGLLFMQNGRWKDRQIVPQAWIQDIMENGIPLSQFNPNFTHLAYRSLWWSDKVGEHRAYYGSGFGGQLLLTIPDLELIVVSHQEHFVDFPQAEKQRSAFSRQVFPLIIEAVQ